ncbi:hypothetical protein HDU97_002700 [Phlyctochytrium planicorne]|nr:hypothetical protein HDU97_002700 [Phlyctochytrium planicorne]
MECNPHMDANGGSYTRWIIDSDLFDAAYVNVAGTNANWWWSAQLLNFSITMIVFYWTEGAHRVVVLEREDSEAPKVKVKGKGTWFISALIYTLLGFFGAISASLPLFLIQRSVLSRSGPYTISRPARPSTLLTFSVVFTAIAVMLTPFITVKSPYFGVNLKVIHILLLTPMILASGITVIFWPAVSPKRRQFLQGVGLAPIYSFLAGISLTSHLSLSMEHFVKNGGSIWSLLQVLEGNPCQLSISADLIFTTVVASVFMLREAVIGPASGRIKAGIASKEVQRSVAFDAFVETVEDADVDVSDGAATVDCEGIGAAIGATCAAVAEGVCGPDETVAVADVIVSVDDVLVSDDGGKFKLSRC